MQTIHRITKLLEFLSGYKDGLGINEISQRLDLPLSTTHRMLNSLRKDGYVTQDDLTKRYKLGVKILSLAINQLNNMDIIKIANPIIEELSTKYGQLVYLSVLENNKIVCVDMVNNAELVKYHVRLGSSMPIHCSAAAKSIVAYLDRDRINEFLENNGMKAYTNHTKLDACEIKDELYMIRKLGYAICDEEMEIGVKAFSTPIFGMNGKVYSSITMVLMKQIEIDEEQIIKDFKRASNKVSEHIGYVE